MSRKGKLKTPEQIFRELLDRRLEISLERTMRGDYEGQVPVLDARGRPSYGLLRVLPAEGQAGVEYQGLHLGTVGLRENLGESGRIFLEYTLPTEGGLLVGRVSLQSRVGLEAIVAATTVPAAPPAPPGAADIIEREERAGGERREPTRRRREPATTTPSLEGIPELLQTRPLEYLVGKLEQRIVREGFYEPASSQIKLGSESYSPDKTFSIRESSSILGNTPAAIGQWSRSDSPLVNDLVVGGEMSASAILCVKLCDLSNRKTFDSGEIGYFFGIEEREAQYLVDVGFFKMGGKHQATGVRGKFREVYDLAMQRLTSSEPQGKRRPDNVPEWRTIPSFVEGKYDYGLRFQGEQKGKALEQFRLAYQDEFNRRLLEEFVLAGDIHGNSLVLGSAVRRHHQEYHQRISNGDLAEILGVDKSKLNKMVRRFDNSLYREGADGIYVSPFFALVWDDPFSMEGSVITSKPFSFFGERTLLDEKKDEQLHSYLKSSGVLRQIHDSAVISCEDASVLYVGMVSRWAATMRSDETRANLMKEVGYLTQKQMIEMLRSQENGIEGAYERTEELRAKAVLGMIHFRDVSALLDATSPAS